MVLEKLDSHVQKIETGPPSYTINLLEENLGSKLLNKSLDNDFFFLFETKSKRNKSKNKQTGLHQTKKLLHSERNYRQNKKSTY